MANAKNLIPNSKRTPSERRENARKGGLASAEARRKKRDLRLAIETLLEKDYTSKNGETVSGAEAIAIKQFEKAMKGDTRAFEVLRDTAGQKPIEKVMVADVEQSVIDEVEKAVLGDD
jgi:hypothetical protein